jgi:CMP/dCMP kinase
MAEGAVHVDGTAYSLEDVVDLVVSLVEAAAGLNREGTP